MNAGGTARRGRAAVLASTLLVSACGAAGPDHPQPLPTAATTLGSATPAPAATASTTTAATSSTTLPDGEGEGRPTETPVDPAALVVPESASGTTTVVTVPGVDTPAAKAPGRVVRYTVEVEKGLEEVAVGFPAAVRAHLTDPRGWQTADDVRFDDVTPEQRAKGAGTDIRILFASPRLVDEECAPLRTGGRLSCHHDGKVMINAWRWVHGSRTYGADLARYRVYLVNHEVGHALGHGHRPCPAPGAAAPVMLQQTLRLEGCRPNPYPMGGAH